MRSFAIFMLFVCAIPMTFGYYIGPRVLHTFGPVTALLVTFAFGATSGIIGSKLSRSLR